MSEEFPVEALLEWFEEHRRDLPWREDRSPYEVWVAEVMLQQTRVSTVEEYYEDFLEAFPSVEALAAATQDEVLKAWEGMGFYARARRLHRAARTVLEEHDGELPSEHDALLELSGVGEYTAAAVEAFAFDGDRPVMDGNVKRVMVRWAGVETPLKRSDTEGRIRSLLEDLLDRTDSPGSLSEGIMELGALVCTSGTPSCGECPLRESCTAYREDRTGELPVTESSGEKPHHEIAVAVVEREDEVLIARRPEDKMLGGLWEFPGGKQEDGEDLREAVVREMNEELGVTVGVGEKIDEVPHQYSHLSITLHAYRCEITEGEPSSREGQEWKWVRSDDLNNYAFPKANKEILETITDSSSKAGTPS